MPRTSSDLLRSVRRTKILSDNALNGETGELTDPFGLEVRCRYCPKSFTSRASLSRHVALTESCLEAHHIYNAAQRAELARRRAEEEEEAEHQQGAADEMEVDAEGEEPWDYGEGTSAQGALGQWATACEPAPTPPSTPIPPAYEVLPDGTILEYFPIPGAGSPISDEQLREENPETYLKACGTLSDPDYFEIAELLMTTGLSNASRNRMLKSKLVS
ncbi:hypothetical protein FRC12_002297 [Ceratobasidium sp. 428]|nr:hypothetical protein FRC12_002297 [Ceratobasidium sp. 428]